MTYNEDTHIVSLDDAKLYLKLDDQADSSMLGYLLNAVSDMFNTATDRTLIAADLTEYYQGRGTDSIYLRNYPVNSTPATIEVYLDADRTYDAPTQIEAENLWIDSTMGRLVYLGATFPVVYGVKVVYNAGYTRATVPYDLRLAALEALGVLWKRSQEGRFDTETLSRGDVSYTYLSDMPYPVTQAIARYRTIG